MGAVVVKKRKNFQKRKKKRISRKFSENDAISRDFVTKNKCRKISESLRFFLTYEIFTISLHCFNPVPGLPAEREESMFEEAGGALEQVFRQHGMMDDIDEE